MKLVFSFSGGVKSLGMVKLLPVTICTSFPFFSFPYFSFLYFLIKNYLFV